MLYHHKPGNTTAHQEPPEGGRGKERFFAKGFRGSKALVSQFSDLLFLLILWQLGLGSLR